MDIRPSTPADSEQLRAIERSAGRRFDQIGMGWVAAHEPMSTTELAEFAEAGRSWVAVGEDGLPVGYIVVEVVDGCAHIEQVSVELEHQGKGIGRALLAEVESWAASSGFGALTLTTFAEVPWNRPYYEYLGFSLLDSDELSPGLTAIRDDEAERGLDPADRVCMRKVVPPAT
jgi:GNAT superfamily N-acetyltransferase